MSKRSNTFPNTNARRAGRTNPDLIEMREETNVPSLGYRLFGAITNTANRLSRRHRHHGTPINPRGHAAARPWPPTPTDAERLALWNQQQARGYQTPKPELKGASK